MEDVADHARDKHSYLLAVELISCCADILRVFRGSLEAVSGAIKKKLATPRRSPLQFALPLHDRLLSILRNYKSRKLRACLPFMQLCEVSILALCKTLRN